MVEACGLVDKLMTGLGLSGYFAQGGDIGSFYGRILAADHESCKALHSECLLLISRIALANEISKSQHYEETRRCG